jgi:hypothetical protein
MNELEKEEFSKRDLDKCKRHRGRKEVFRLLVRRKKAMRWRRDEAGKTGRSPRGLYLTGPHRPG